ncbi:LA_3334 family protein [Leptospira brenneri]|uniref:LA_3334 family protein n=1 Tax=Leptospira brenneri TaxID=2023182 RepID=UPI000C2A5FC7|nr:hypothetical protein [Leptospira brenneri]PJZ45842.1 hypothetical protein CH361_07600 [Leptospira brenneri]
MKLNFKLHKYVTIFLFLLSLDLNSVQIQFSNGNVYHATFISDDSHHLFVKYRGKDYKIPKKEIENFDISNNSNIDSSYSLSTFRLRNGSRIRGLIAEEKKDEFIVKTELGFLTILKSEILPPTPSKSENPDFPEEYLSFDKENNQTTVGLSLFLLPTYSPLSKYHPLLEGTSIFVEPAFLKWNSNWQVGFKMEHFRSNGNGESFSIQTGNIYGLYSRKFNNNELLNFYSSLSLGIGQVNYRTNDGDVFGGRNSSFGFDIGWQGLKFSNSLIRIGLKNQCFIETKDLFCGSGLEIQGGWVF